MGNLSAVSLALLASWAHANGQGSHLWISQQAVGLLPAGELRDLLSDEALQPILMNGSMFPDGGYAAADDYGEMAHWEPFQDTYLAWIRQQFSPPWTDEARQHMAFYLGMASHGMADQVYDSLFVERAQVEDAQSDWANESMDEATDVVFVHVFFFKQKTAYEMLM